MKGKLSAIVNFRLGTWILLTLFGVLVICIIFVGLDDMLGYILGYLATTALFLIPIRHWRSIKKFLILLAVSFFGIIFLAFLYVEVVSRIAVGIWGGGALQSAPLGIIELVFTYIMLFLGPVGMFLGIVGSFALGISRLVAMKNRSSPAGNT
jgi:hypothetical protein